jgi:hypothetical protein
MTEGTLLLQSFVATSMINTDSSRVRNPSQETRKEGWTEEWGVVYGNKQKHNQIKTAASDETEQSSNTTAASYTASTTAATGVPTSTPLTVVQFRPAWFEQLVLRMAGIPHVVRNSPYAATEATGPLPLLVDRVTLVGHNQPVTTGMHSSPPDRNDILHHLRQRTDWKLDHEIATDSSGATASASANNTSSINMTSKAHLVSNLISTQLQPALQVLHFQDEDAWQQIYRPLYYQAGQGTAALPLGAWFQAWSLRVVAIKQYNSSSSSSSSSGWTVDKAKQVIKDCYVTLEAMLLHVQQESSSRTILGTKELTTVDALLWAHLTDALCDVHVVIILSSFPNLVQFFQQVHERYFVDSNTSASWLQEASQANTDNVFTQQLPLPSSSKSLSKKQQLQPYTSALELMQSLRPNLQDVLIATKETRQREAALRKINQPPHESMIYTWRMGGTPAAKKKAAPGDKKDTASDEERPSAKKWREEHKSNDELWISCVIGVTALAMVFGTAQQK